MCDYYEHHYTKEASRMNTLKQAQEMLARLGAEKFFGTVAFQFKGGQIVLIRREETILPSEVAPNYGRTTSHDRNQQR